MELRKIFPFQAPNPWELYFQGSNPLKRYSCLVDGSNLVMSDTPYERTIYQDMLYAIEGKVLILGMGIGLLNSMMALEQCTKVVCVDNNPKAFEIARQYLRRKAHQQYTEVLVDATDIKALQKALDGERFHTIVWDLFGPKFADIYQPILEPGGTVIKWEAR